MSIRRSFIPPFEFNSYVACEDTFVPNLFQYVGDEKNFIRRYFAKPSLCNVFFVRHGAFWVCTKPRTQNMVLIVISGASGAGKSTISTNLAKMIHAVIVPQDSFYKVPFNNHHFIVADDNDVEGPGLIDWERLCEVVVRLLAAVDVNVIVEGHCVFSCDILVELADTLVFLDAQPFVIKKRFMNRYSENYTTEQLEKKERYFDEKTWPCHEQYVDTVVTPLSDSDKDKFVKVEADIERGTQQIVEFIEQKNLV